MQEKIRDRIAQIVDCFVKDFEFAENAYKVSLNTLGIGAEAFIQLIGIVQEEFGVEISYECMLKGEYNTISEIVEAVIQESA